MGQQSTTNPKPPHPHLIRIALFLLLLSAPIAQAQSTISALSVPLILPSAVTFDPTGKL